MSGMVNVFKKTLLNKKIMNNENEKNIIMKSKTKTKNKL
jgi:hypothetical protein